MLLSFSVANFRSFLDEQTLSLVASKRLAGHHDAHTVELPDSEERALRAAVVYGANGAGKSNLFKAIEFLKTAATKTRRKGTGTRREAFKFCDAGEMASQFDIQFLMSGHTYRFGLVVDDERVIEEWLTRIEGIKDRVIYERTTSAAGNVEVRMPGAKRAKDDKIQAIATVGGPPNQTFLATIIENLDDSSMPSPVRDAVKWFKVNLTLVRPDGPIAPIGHYLSVAKGFPEFASSFLRAASTGVEEIAVKRKKLTLDQVKAMLGPSSWEFFQERIVSMQPGEASLISRGDNEILIEKSEEQSFYSLDVEASHQCANGASVKLALREESDGTRRLLDLLPALYDRKANRQRVFIIDEIERSLHPALMKKLLTHFLDPKSGNGNQIIVTTHESHLLDLDLLRRDEIWFAEKGHGLETHLHSLSQFKVRTDLDLRKNYFQGRFGGIPFLGDIDRLIEIADGAADGSADHEKEEGESGAA
ncbi:AAA family ATPase [Stenotrophomonas maltophilia]|jgi:AAA15 family ATPase/GTPase|uniref:AAA family ATPase n=1 Tax=Stenotrophomonas maltophilia TaxID=40324 RepID=UPI000DA75CF2|nr:ATP-binding protein [Stenotrophomonas maltophilia]EKT4097540.1 AAA family ATPase [Stenotrophomonas maltophilia]MBN4998847.1 AAA family ATPase [Stenotrophomonas maltophilia]MBN5007342.1 AAA family ATPase [Stenotrophomonas maltophilia]